MQKMDKTIITDIHRIDPDKFDAKAKLITDMSIEDYHADHSILSKSMLVEMECPAKFKWKYIDGGKQPDKGFLNIGNAVHTLALEPQLFESRFHVLPASYTDSEGKEKPFRCDPRMKVYKDEIEKAGTRKIIAAGDLENIKGMAKSLASNKMALAILNRPGKIEASVFWTDEETGLRLKCRPDFFGDDSLIVDLKVTHSADPQIFFKTAFDIGYDMSAAMTTAGITTLLGKRPDNYVFLVIEDKPPYVIEAFDSFRPFEPDAPAALSYFDAGDYRFRAALMKYKKCTETGIWPGYREKITPMGVPYYGIKQLEQGA
jgi:exodeoxyribonuclease VIII